jgi:hypothetical protein
VFGLSEALIVFDSNRIGGLSLEQLAGYTAMAALVDLNFDAAPTQAPTIQRLFSQSEDARPQALTTWDGPFLSATYQTAQTVVDQRDQIATKVLRDASK